MDNFDQYNSVEPNQFIAELKQKEAALLHKQATADLHADETVQLIEIQEILNDQHLLATATTIDVEAGWSVIRQKIDSKEKPASVKPLTRYLAYAASIALIMAIGWLVWQNMPGHSGNVNKQLTGLDKHQATLILEDGTSIALNQKTSQKITDGTAVLSDSARAISYQSANVKTGVYHTLVVPRGGEYKIVMSDGTEIWLNSETKLRYPATVGSTGNRVVYLESGEAYFMVAKNKNAPFMVNLKGMQVEVLGTSFNVSTYDQKVTTTLVEGSISVNRDGQAAVHQKPGEQSVFDPTTQTLSKSTVDVYPYTSWKDGWLVFNDNSLGEVMDQVGRWYDYQVAFESSTLKALRFGGKLRKSKNIRAVLAIIERSNEVKYKISDQNIYIYSKK